MSSRGDHRRRDRSWERDDKDRGARYSRGGRGGRGGGSHRDEPRRRSSRSRSPRRDDRDRRGYDRRDHRRDDDRGDKGRRDDRRRDDRRDRDYPRDDRREPPRRDDTRDSASRDAPAREPDVRDGASKADSFQQHRADSTTPAPPSHSRPNLDPDAPEHGEEEGEEMDATNDEEAAMMAMMGVAGFGSTKGKHVEGNQTGSVDVKKVRTWRQYMNRRGGFNRPLDKIK